MSCSHLLIIGPFLWTLFTVVDIIQGDLGFLEGKKLPRRKYLYGENKIFANFHVMWFISLLLLSILRYLSPSVGSESIGTHTVTNNRKFFNEWITHKRQRH